MLGEDSTCSIARGVDAIGDAWSLLIVREAMLSGATRFQEFRENLGVASNILAKRLATLVDRGLMERRSYQESGSRARDEYVLTDAGRGLSVVIAALSDWARAYRPRADGTSPAFTIEGEGVPAMLAFMTPDGSTAEPERLVARRTEDADLKVSR